MMSTNARVALALGKSAWNRYSEFRDRKADQAYEALAKAADITDDVADDVKEKTQALFDDSRKEAGKVAKAARERLENAKSSLQDSTKDVTDSAASFHKSAAKHSKKMSKRTRKRIEKARAQAAKKAEKKLGRKKDHKGLIWWIVGLITLAGAAAAWFLTQRKQEVGYEPPRVEEFSGEQDSQLVYSTSTPAADVPQEPVEENESAGKHRLRDDHPDQPDEVVEGANERNLGAVTLEENVEEHHRIDADYDVDEVGKALKDEEK